MKQSKIAIIGAGAVGSTTAYTLMKRNIASKIILIDIDEKKCKGEVDDLTDALSFGSNSEISMGKIHQAGQADIAIITAGVPQKPGQSRIDLLKTNIEIIKSVISKMKPLNSDLVIIMVTNPVDILTYICQQNTDLPKNQIFGSGTFLDTARLRHEISKKVKIAPQSIHLYVLGEHGDSQFVAWSTSTIGGIPTLEFPKLNKKELHEMANSSRLKAYSIIECKGSTAFGIASCITAYCENIIFDTKRITPVSCYIEELDLCMSMPAVLGTKGVENILIPTFNDEERLHYQNSANVIRNHIKAIE